MAPRSQRCSKWRRSWVWAPTTVEALEAPGRWAPTWRRPAAVLIGYSVFDLYLLTGDYQSRTPGGGTSPPSAKGG
eukprot:10683756-Alexandrium_andersonii.AAC.1